MKRPEFTHDLQSELMAASAMVGLAVGMVGTVSYVVLTAPSTPKVERAHPKLAPPPPPATIDRQISGIGQQLTFSASVLYDDTALPVHYTDGGKDIRFGIHPAGHDAMAFDVHYGQARTTKNGTWLKPNSITSIAETQFDGRTKDRIVLKRGSNGEWDVSETVTGPNGISHEAGVVNGEVVESPEASLNRVLANLVHDAGVVGDIASRIELTPQLPAQIA